MAEVRHLGLFPFCIGMFPPQTTVNNEIVVFDTGPSSLYPFALKTEDAIDGSDGVIKVIFNRVGTMIIEGNPNLEKLINMYDASSTAIASANEVFEITQQENLLIAFDRNGKTIYSNIPSVPEGSTIDTFIEDFCHLAPKNTIKLSITKNALERNYMEYWNAMPAGSIESFEANIKQLQNKLPLNYTLQIKLAPGEDAEITIFDSNGNPQEQQSSENCAGTSGITFNYITNYVSCVLQSFDWL
jgi:hypothetical protein